MTISRCTRYPGSPGHNFFWLGSPTPVPRVPGYQGGTTRVRGGILTWTRLFCMHSTNSYEEFRPRTR
eukprot:1879774-Rhodomonas_salina.3